jgi:hypothetical protein
MTEHVTVSDSHGGAPHLDAANVAAAIARVNTDVEQLARQRAEIIQSVTDLIAWARQTLAGLGAAPESSARPALAPARRPARGGYKRSPAVRAKLRAAWARRKAEAAKKGQPLVSARTRARVAEAQRRRWARRKAER